MKIEFDQDTTEIDNEIATLKSLRENVMRGHMEAGRDDDNRLVFRLTSDGRELVKNMVNP